MPGSRRNSNYARIYDARGRELDRYSFDDERPAHAEHARQYLRALAASGHRIVLWRHPRWAFGWSFVSTTIKDGPIPSSPIAASSRRKERK